METGSIMFYVLCILLIIVMAIIFIAPIVLVVVITKWIFKRGEQIAKESDEKAMRIHEENARIEQEHINIKKRKYQRTRCVYCGSLNPIDDKHCSQCGGALTGKNAVEI